MNAGQRRLRDWKEIAAFFGRDERTVRRWERQRGLPVHRISGGARNLVFAYTDELERWLRGGGDAAPDRAQPAATAPEIVEPPVAVAASVPVAEAAASARRTRWPLAIAAACAIGLLAIAGGLATSRGPALPVGVAYKPEPRVQSLYLDAVYALGTRQADGFMRACSC